jgi:hypothetical protein
MQLAGKARTLTFDPVNVQRREITDCVWRRAQGLDHDIS